MTEEIPRFRSQTIKQLLDISLTKANGGEKTRISQTTVDLIAEYLRCVVVEATERAASAAGDSRSVDESHLEKVLPQLLLDIS